MQVLEEMGNSRSLALELAVSEVRLTPGKLRGRLFDHPHPRKAQRFPCQPFQL